MQLVIDLRRHGKEIQFAAGGLKGQCAAGELKETRAVCGWWT